jgi:hypothetical protein
MRFATFSHIEPVERLVNDLGRAARIIHFASAGQEFYGVNSVLCGDTRAGSVEPAR